jgi:tellurite resistance protein TehA-like permease
MRIHYGDFIQSLYVVPVFYIAIFALIVGNFLYLYYYVIGAAKRGKWELIPYSLLIPIYWIMMSAATYFSIYDLLIRPFHWYKTTHGLHLAKEEQRKNAEVLLQDAI